MNSHTENNTDNERTDKKRWFALYTLALGLAMIVVDGTIVGVALPDIITKLNLTDAQWVNSLYSVVFAALVLSIGRLADRIGRRRMFLVGVPQRLVGCGRVLVHRIAGSTEGARLRRCKARRRRQSRRQDAARRFGSTLAFR